ncbi:MAG: preprotein translocase subunit YajC [Bacteroidales bacterium]|nr:preprotein translocase subunit YajC [Bacteroidales bacterium]
MNNLLIMLQAAAEAAPAKKGLFANPMIWLILMLVLMWILMMGPQRKKAKAEQKFREGLQKGDRVVFSGGIYGKVHSIDEHTVDVEVANGVVMTVEKSMIQAVPDEKKEDKKDSKDEKRKEIKEDKQK